MSENHYKKALETARAELADLTRQKDEIEKRIAQLRQTVVSLAAISEEEEEGEEDEQIYIPGPLIRAQQAAMEGMAKIMAGRTIGFSDAVREVLKADNDYMSPLEVRAGLIRMGIDVDAKYTNALAVIHRTLKRLHDNEEVETKTIEGKTNYRWKSSLPRWSKKLIAEAAKREEALKQAEEEDIQAAKKRRYALPEAKKEETSIKPREKK